MAGIVPITITVTDANAAEAVQQVTTQLNALGPAGEAAGAAAGAGLDQVGTHSLTARENVRLLSEELGLRVPRAMQSVIAQSELMTGAIGAIAPAMIAIGGVDILIHLGESAYAAFQKYVELKGVIEDSNTVIRSFGDSAEAAMNRASEATERYIRLTQGAQAADVYKLGQYQNTAIGIPQYQSDQFKRLPDEVKGNFEKITGESVMPKDLDATIAKLKDYEAEQEKILANEKAAKSGVVLGGQYSESQLRQMTQQQQLVSMGAGLISDLQGQQDDYAAHVKEDQAQIAADAKTKADEAVAKAKEKNDEILSLENSARNAQLSGDALLEAQREEAIASFVSKYGQSRAAMNAIDDDWMAKELALWDKQAKEAEDKNQKILAAQQQFTKEMDQVGTRSDDQQVEGYARIADMAAQKTKKIQDDWDEVKKLIGDATPAGVDDQLIAADRITEEDQKADRQREQLHAKTMEEITKEEEQAARLSLAPWQQTEMAIIDAYDDRYRKIKDDVLAGVMADTEGARAVAAAWQEANAQIQKDGEETRDKLAQGLQSLFSNPAQFFEKRAMDTAFQLMANEMLSAFKSSTPVGGIMQYLFGMGPQMSTSTNPMDAMSSALGIGGHAAEGTATNAALVQFQQGGTTLLTASQMLMSAASAQQAAAGTMGASGGLGIGGSGGIGSGIFGGAGVSTATGSGAAAGDFDISSAGGSTNPLMMPGMGAGGISTGGLDAMVPGLTGVSSMSALGPGAAASTGGASALGAAAGIGAGALMAGTSIYSAYQNSNPLSGAVGGAMGGMEGGAAIGSIVPGIGTVVGAIGGALIGGIGGLLAGIFGDQGRGKAQDLDTNTIQPTLTKDMQDFEAGRAGYNTEAAELNSMLISAQNQTFQMGSGARSYFGQRIQPEIQAVLSSLQKQEIGGRSAITLSAAQYHSGGWTGDFGDLATSETEGFIHAAQNEFVVNPMAAAAHAPMLTAMNNGTNFSYSNSVQPRMPASSGAGAGMSITIQALDSKSVAQWAKAGGGLALMAALNQAQKQYSGVGRG